MFSKKYLLKNFAKFTGKHLCQSLPKVRRKTNVNQAKFFKTQLFYIKPPGNFFISYKNWLATDYSIYLLKSSISYFKNVQECEPGNLKLKKKLNNGLVISIAIIEVITYILFSLNKFPSTNQFIETTVLWNVNTKLGTKFNDACNKLIVSLLWTLILFCLPFEQGKKPV